MNSLRDLNARIPGAPDFMYKEFVKSDTALRLDISNDPKEKEWQCIETLAVKILQPVRGHFGRIRITSGFRTVRLCKAVGSSAKSNHTLGQAVDFEPINPKIKLFSILEWIYHNLEYRELIAEFFPDGWIHCAYRQGGNEKILKLKDAKHNYDHVTLDYIRRIYG